MQDNYGNLVAPHGRWVEESQFNAMVGQVEKLKVDLEVNTAATQRVEKNTAEVVAAFQAAQGAFKTLELLGKVAKPLIWIGSLGSAMAYAWLKFKAGFFTS